jgi:hypothetical protein
VSDKVRRSRIFGPESSRLPEQESFKNAFDIIFAKRRVIYADLLAAAGHALAASSQAGVSLREGEVLHLYRRDFE